MKNIIKIFTYYLLTFFLISNMFYFLNTIGEKEANKTSVEEYILTPNAFKDLKEDTKISVFGIMKETATDSIKMILYFIITTVPLAIYMTGKYVKSEDEEIEEIEISSVSEIRTNKEKYSVKINERHRNLIENRFINLDLGLYLGLVSNDDEMDKMYLSLDNKKYNNTLILEEARELTTTKKMLDSLAETGDSVIVFDIGGGLFKSKKDLYRKQNYDVRKINLMNPENGNRINLLEYFNSDEEIHSLAQIIARGKSEKTVLLESIISVVKNDYESKYCNLKEVYKYTADDNFTVFEGKLKEIKEAKEIYDRLTIIDRHEKRELMKELRDDLLVFTKDNLNYEDNSLNLNMLKQKSCAYFIIVPENYVANTAANSLMSVVYNVIKSTYNLLGSEKENRVYIMISDICRLEYMQKLAMNIELASRYKMFYILGITNLKDFTNKYTIDAKTIFVSSDVKVYNKMMQKETLELLSKDFLELGKASIENVLNKLDTSKCIVTLKAKTYMILNREIPSGFEYEKYKYVDDNTKILDRVKNLDLKTEVKVEKVVPKKELTPQISSEEKEFLADLFNAKVEPIKKVNKEDLEKDEFYEISDEEEVEENIEEKEEKLDRRINQVEIMKGKISELVKEERKKSAHALYDQIDKL